jgi:AraC-like DNA-binding protein
MMPFLIKEKRLFLFFLKTWFFTFVFLFSIFGLSQDRGFVVPDSLKGKNLKELENGYFNYNKNLKIAEIYAKTILINGKKENNNKKIAKAFRHLSNLNENNNLELVYLDSIINLDFKKEDLIYKAAALFTKGAFFDEKHNYEEALDNYNLALSIATEHNKLFLVYDIKHNIGILKSEIGDDKESLEIFKDCYKYYLNKKENNYNHIISIYSLANAYSRINKLDSSDYYNKLGILKIKNNKNIELKKYFILNQGINLFLRNKYRSSINIIQQKIPVFKKNGDKNSLRVSFFYLGKSFFKVNKPKMGIYYFKKMDSIIQKEKYLKFYEREAYEIIINYFKKTNKLKNQLIYTNKLIKVDSVLYSNLKNISKNLVLNYNSPNLIKEKEKLINTLNIKSKKSKGLIKLFVLTTILFVFISLFYFYKQYSYKIRFKMLINQHNNQNEFTEKNITPLQKNFKDKLISNDKAKSILKEILKFEKELGFLEIKLTQNIMAKKINTNSTYLSKIINQYKNTNFSTYINNLRVDYAIKKLKEDSKLFLLSIDGMSNEFGFNNSETFSKAFHKKAGIYPSYFIKQLKKHKV